MFKKITTNFMNDDILNKKAFSLTEILITIGVISVLTSMAVTTYVKYNIRAESSAAMQQLEYYVKAAQNYYLENNVMPSAISQLNASTSAINNVIINLTKTSSTTVKLSATFNDKVTNTLRNKSINMEVTSSTNGMFNVTCTGGNTASCPGEPN